MLRTTTIGFAALAMLAAIGPAQRTGQPAPDINFIKKFHCDDVKAASLAQLKGSVVLLEFWLPEVRECEIRIDKLNALHRRYFDRGLVVVGVTIADEDKLEAYMAKENIEFPVVYASFKGYDAKTLPYTVLVDIKGNVVSAGLGLEFDATTIDPLLADARPANLAPGLEEVGKLSAAGKLGDAYAKCKELLAGDKLSDEARSQAEHRVAMAESTVSSGLENATKAIADGDFHRAYIELDPIAKGYQGVPGAEDAATKVAAMLADKKQKREIDAGEALAQVARMASQRDYDNAFKEYKKLANTWRGTRASTTANAAALAIQKGGKLGFERGCGSCIAGDKACPLHAKKR